tara:strand:+ start:4824 stop:5084 length:261 start_codon:yes stop_codon:yes gene_type:complete
VPDITDHNTEIIMQSQIQCPLCGGSLALNTELLLAGHSFTCANCGSCISLASGSHRTVQSAMTEFSRLKARTGEVGQAAQKAIGKG